MNLNLRPKEECQFDAVSLGEVMLRLDPGEGRIRTARNFRAWEGGGEYNVVRGLRRCFGMKTAVITAFADNEVGKLMEDFILQGGVDTSLINWKKTDGIGRICRNGINFTERGFGIRGAVGCSDRANTAIAQATPEDFDFDYIFGELGVRWLHTGGIYAALSEQSCVQAVDLLLTGLAEAHRVFAQNFGREVFELRPESLLQLFALGLLGRSLFGVFRPQRREFRLGRGPGSPPAPLRCGSAVRSAPVPALRTAGEAPFRPTRGLLGRRPAGLRRPKDGRRRRVRVLRRRRSTRRDGGIPGARAAGRWRGWLSGSRLSV